MHVTKSRLKKIIQEELETLLLEIDDSARRPGTSAPSIAAMQRGALSTGASAGSAVAPHAKKGAIKQITTTSQSAPKKQSLERYKRRPGQGPDTTFRLRYPGAPSLSTMGSWSGPLASGRAEATVSPLDLASAGAGLAKSGAQGVKQLTKSAASTAKPTLAKFAQKAYGAVQDISTFKDLGPTSKK